MSIVGMTYFESLQAVIKVLESLDHAAPEGYSVAGPTTLGDMRLDSLDLIELQMALEYQWPKLEGLVDEISRETTVEDLARIVHENA